MNWNLQRGGKRERDAAGIIRMPIIDQERQLRFESTETHRYSREMTTQKIDFGGRFIDLIYTGE